MVGQGFVVAVEIVVRVVVTVEAVGVAREVVLVSSRREIWVEVVVIVDVGPAQGGSEVWRGDM